MNIFGKDQRRGLPFPPKIDRKEKRVVSFTHEQNIICCQTELDDVAYEQTIICMQLFVILICCCCCYSVYLFIYVVRKLTFRYQLLVFNCLFIVQMKLLEKSV